MYMTSGGIQAYFTWKALLPPRRKGRGLGASESLLHRLPRREGTWGTSSVAAAWQAGRAYLLSTLSVLALLQRVKSWLEPTELPRSVLLDWGPPVLKCWIFSCFSICWVFSVWLGSPDWVYQYLLSAKISEHVSRNSSVSFSFVWVNYQHFL